MNLFLKSVFFLCLFFSIKLFSGFAAGTMVKVPSGYKPIEQLETGDIVFSITKSGDCCLRKVTKTTSYFLSRTLLISVDNELIVAAPQQKFYDPKKNTWRKAKRLQRSMPLLSGHKKIVTIDDVEFLDQEIEFFDLRLDDHTFFVSTQDIVAHNFPPFFIGFSIAFGGGISFDGIYCGICIAGWWLGTKLLKRGDNQKYKPEFSVGCSPDCAGGPDPEDDDFFEKLKKRDGKKARHQYFGKFYRDETKLWWSKSNADHAGPHYKVFQEGSRGLEWVHDVDLSGKIMNKHKGPIGRFIPYKELIFLS